MGEYTSRRAGQRRANFFDIFTAYSQMRDRIIRGHFSAADAQQYNRLREEITRRHIEDTERELEEERRELARCHVIRGDDTTKSSLLQWLEERDRQKS